MICVVGLYAREYMLRRLTEPDGQDLNPKFLCDPTMVHSTCNESDSECWSLVEAIVRRLKCVIIWKCRPLSRNLAANTSYQGAENRGATNDATGFDSAYRAEHWIGV